MQVNVRGESRYIPVSTVTLQREEDGVTWPFHCVTCGNTHTVVGGKVVKVYPIQEPSRQIPVVSTCKSCKAKYIFQDTEDEEKIDKITILLSPKSIRQSFYCYLGGGEIKNINKILDYDTLQGYSHLEHSMVTFPFTTHCTNLDCTLVYTFLKFS